MAEAIRASGGEAKLILEDQAPSPAAPVAPAAPAGWSEPAPFRPNPFDDQPALSNDNAALRVLCAEDNPANQRLLKVFLELAGVACTLVNNGAEAVAAWRREPWDIILMDIQMPVMDGPTATREIRALEAESGRARTPILAVTAEIMPHQITTYLASEMDAVISKPITAAVLLAEMAEALATPHGPLANAAIVAEARLAALRA